MSSFDKGTMLMPRLRVGELHRLATVRFLPSLAPLRIFFFLQQLLLPLSLYLSLSLPLCISLFQRAWLRAVRACVHKHVISQFMRGMLIRDGAISASSIPQIMNNQLRYFISSPFFALSLFFFSFSYTLIAFVRRPSFSFSFSLKIYIYKEERSQFSISRLR